MDHLRERLVQLQQREQLLLMELDEVRVLVQAYNNTLEGKTE
jgi:hypothetical protein